jgi:hypothetical protein
MPIYGYKREVANAEFGLLELREISFNLQADDLRRVSRFLERCAVEIESGLWRSSHVHLSSLDPSWRACHPDTDVIVLNPDPEPPGRCE